LDIAQSVETAHAEYFGESLSTQTDPLTLGELALHRESSFTTFAKQLRRRLLMEPTWRQEPSIFGIPSPSQIFGRFARDADWEAVLYPSRRGSGLCLGVFTENFRASGSLIEVVGAIPAGATHTLLDKDHLS
jgi:hypothetical protein